MANEKRIYKWYLLLVIVYSSLTLLSLFVFNVPVLELLHSAFAQGDIGIFWFIFTLVMLVVFLTKKIEKVALWIPILYLVDSVFSVLSITIILRIISLGQGTDFVTASQNTLVPILLAVFPAIILIFSIKLLLRK